jgi:hypothetical protein
LVTRGELKEITRRGNKEEEETRRRGKNKKVNEEKTPPPDDLESAPWFLGHQVVILARNQACHSFLESLLDFPPTLKISRAKSENPRTDSTLTVAVFATAGGENFSNAPTLGAIFSFSSTRI